MNKKFSIGDYVDLKPYKEIYAKGWVDTNLTEDQYNLFCEGPLQIVSSDGYEYVLLSTTQHRCFSVYRDAAIEIIAASNSSSKVHHPSHYNQNGMEVWDVIKAFTSNLSGVEAFYAGNAIKYILRWDKKNGIEDLEKAKVYIDKIIEGRKGDDKASD